MGNLLKNLNTSTSQHTMADLYLSSKSDYDSAVAASAQKPLIIDFTASWCPPCQRIGPIFERMAGENADSVTMRKVDVDANGEAAQAAGIQCMPSSSTRTAKRLTSSRV